MPIKPVESAFYASLPYYALRSAIALCLLIFFILLPWQAWVPLRFANIVASTGIAVNSWLLVIWGKRCLSTKPLLEINAIGWIDRRPFLKSQWYTWQEVSEINSHPPTSILLDSGKKVDLHMKGLRTTATKLHQAMLRHWNAYRN